jgi:hypothetical protein
MLPFLSIALCFAKKIIHKRYIGVKAEPVENFINSQAILYLARLHTDNLNPLLKEAFELSKSLDSQGVSNNHEALAYLSKSLK